MITTSIERTASALTATPQTAPQLAKAARVNPCGIYRDLWQLRREGRAKSVEVQDRRDRPRLFWGLPDPTPAQPPTPGPPQLAGFLTPDMSEAERITAIRARVAAIRTKEHHA